MMKHLKRFDDSIESICKKYGITNYSINIDESIDVDGDVNFGNKKLTKLPLKFNKVGGDFNCGSNKLTTLEGSPRVVGGDFYCNNNKLPQVIVRSKYLKKILTQGDDFYIWKRGKLDMSSFEYMIEIFEDEDI